MMVSQALDTLTSMSATARLHTKKYIGECRFLFFTMAAITRMFSSRLMMPRIRNTWRERTAKMLAVCRIHVVLLLTHQNFIDTSVRSQVVSQRIHASSAVGI